MGLISKSVVQVMSTVLSLQYLRYGYVLSACVGAFQVRYG